MKIWLDDERPAPEGWTRARYATEVIGYLTMQKPFHLIEEVSLDHDLGLELLPGYYVLEWLEEELAIRGKSRVIHVPKLFVHSANTSVWKKMQQAIESIERIAADLA